MKKMFFIAIVVLSYNISFACQCDPHEPNFYKNISPGLYNCMAVLDTALLLENEEFLLAQTGYFVVLDSLWNFNNQVGDTIVVQGQDGLNCGAGLLQFSPGDTVFLALSGGYYSNNDENSYYLEGACGTYFLEIENGKNAGLTIPEIKTKIDNIFNSSLSKCSCSRFYSYYDFYNNVSSQTYNCMAIFQDYDYSYSYEGLQSQTGYFKLVDKLGNFSAEIGDEIVVLGEDGINCGEMLNRFSLGDTLFLALSDGYYESFQEDTFYLQGGTCGKYFLKITEGKNNNLSIEEIKEKIRVAVDVPASEFDRSVKIYPNPVENTIEISANDIQIVRIQIVDLNGKLILDVQDIYDSYYKSDVSNLAAGMYNVNLFTNKGVIQKCILKN